MIVRLGLFALALATLLISIIAEAQPLTNPTTRNAVDLQSKIDCLQDVAVIWLHVVKDGKIEKLAFAPDKLSSNPLISVDGYVNGIVLLSTSPLNALVNSKPMSPIRMDADGYYKLKYYGNISRQDFWSTFMPADGDAQRNEKIQGRYSIFPKVPGDALIHAPEFQISLNQKGVSRNLTIRQFAGSKLDIRSAKTDGTGAPDFYYLGNNLSQFDCTSPAFNQRMDALCAGIRTIERNAGSKLVKKVHIIDFEGAHNAYSCNDENEIWLYSKVFWQEPVRELRVIAEHETLHILSDQLGLSTNSQMRELVAELMGFGLFSRERFQIVTSGAPPYPKQADSMLPTMSNLFNFINEVNFIRGMNGGHSQDNMDEFCASFLHSLMYIDCLASLLSQPIKMRDGAFTHLSTNEQARLLNDYERVLKTIVAGIRGDVPMPLTTFLQYCQETTSQAGLSMAVNATANLDRK